MYLYMYFYKYMCIYWTESIISTRISSWDIPSLELSIRSLFFLIRSLIKFHLCGHSDGVSSSMSLYFSEYLLFHTLCGPDCVY